MGDATARSILDHRGCVDLEKILVRFGAPVSEERAWALCYSTVKCYLALDSHERSQSAIVNSLQHLILHKDGSVHPDTFAAPDGTITMEGAGKGRRREVCAPESKMVTELGWVLYSALDYGLGQAEERELSPPLHGLIEQMTLADSDRGEADDEGIERDLGRTYSLKDALQDCEKRLATLPYASITAGVASRKFPSSSSSSVKSSAKTSSARTPNNSPTSLERPVEVTPCDHYRAVIRAFVTEAQDLQQFLDIVAEGKQYLGSSELLSSQFDLDQLQCTDWAVLWKQVMLQLREGVKLKKIDYSKTPLEDTLTPYEMLMEDIRSRRYTLNKVTINGSIPQKVKKDAHSIILDFIRSRPPLNKASERRLKPIQRVYTPMELLLESIRKDQTLRHVQTPTRPRSAVLLGRVTSHGTLAPPKRKLIAAPTITLDIEDDDDDDLSDIPPSSPPSSPQLHSHYLPGSAPPTMRRSNPCSAHQQGKDSTASQWSRLAYDLANYVTPGGGATTDRRHSICVCETPSSSPPSPPPSQSPRPEVSRNVTTPKLSLDARSSSSPEPHSSMPHRTLSAASSATSSWSSPANILESYSKNQREFLSSAHFAAHLDCLSLTLEEVVHIRNVLTKADLEALPLDLTIKEDMAKGKVCFLCMKVRFSFFGQWAVECRLCRRNVCKKCISKMRIPTEHFGNIPVLMLTPQAISPRDDDDDHAASLPRQFLNRLQEFPRGGSERRVSVSGSVGSAPSSPTTSHRLGPPYSLPPHTPDNPPFVHDDIKSSCGAGLKLSLQRLLSSGCATSSPPCVASELLKQEQREQLRHTSPSLECSKDQLRGELMSVCGDCKAMVLHVLLSIKMRRDQHHQQQHKQRRAKTPSPPPLPPPRQHLYLKLTPVYN